MTVTYSEEIATARFSTLFNLLLLRWKGSVFKLLWKELLAYIALFYSIQLTYLYVHDGPEKQMFVEIVAYFGRFNDIIPLSFVLGFFVTNVMSRWWDQYLAIPWPYSIAVYASSTIHGFDEVGRAMRRTIMRYVCLSLTMVFRVLSPRVKARFPLMADMIDAGLLTHNELTIIEDMDQKFPGYSKNWLPIVWAASLVNRARDENRIRDDFAVKTLIEELNKFRGQCGNLMIYNSINIPLVYTQVVTIAVYSYFAVAMISQQYTVEQNPPPRPPQNPQKVDLDYIPIFLTLKFIFYMGWLKVAETMMNPFGEDDDDFEVNYMIDRNIQMSYLIVDEMHKNPPELLKDQYWNAIPNKLPDRFKEENTEHEKLNEPTDTFNVKKQASNHRATVILNARQFDTEAPPAAAEKTNLTGSVRDLVPRSSIIDLNYKEVAGVTLKQSNLEREMEKVRMKALLDMIDGTPIKDSDSDDDYNDETTLRSSTEKIEKKTRSSRNLPRLRWSNEEATTTSAKQKKTRKSSFEQKDEKVKKPLEDIQEESQEEESTKEIRKQSSKVKKEELVPKPLSKVKQVRKPSFDSDSEAELFKEDGPKNQRQPRDEVSKKEDRLKKVRPSLNSPPKDDERTDEKEKKVDQATDKASGSGVKPKEKKLKSPRKDSKSESSSDEY